ncbi:Protein kinase family protein with leucine-rich repeat domain [Striga hermonthica]|uniref:Protein kinase family protein with leucine-rich repeat domain n=1 Tax=Striga hermonthica TaxID=68872 RepID=A0A9N7RMW5_STRHE|nr:Protein kinase family protein with leucine-rich repeat domain [Striga hermonthica]
MTKLPFPHLKQKWGNPPSLQSWNDTCPHCAWSGIQCAGDGSVTGINLTGYDIAGAITKSSFFTFENLIVLDLHVYQFSGNILTAVLNCTKLRYLDLSQNNFVENIPTDIDRLQSLEYINLGSTGFTGDIPPAIGNLTRLRTLMLNYALFNTTYPAEISNLTDLENLGLAYNDITPAVIPPGFRNLRKVKFLWMAQSKLIGRIPDTFSGTIPKSIDSLDLVSLDLSENNLTGEIPEDFGKLEKLELLGLCINRFSGEIPQSLGLLPSLETFKVFMNDLSGILPPEMGSRSRLKSFQDHQPCRSSQKPSCTEESTLPHNVNFRIAYHKGQFNFQNCAFEVQVPSSHHRQSNQVEGHHGEATINTYRDFPSHTLSISINMTWTTSSSERHKDFLKQLEITPTHFIKTT